MHVGFLRSRPPVPQPHWELPGSAGVPPAQSLARPGPCFPLGTTGNGAMALLRPGRWGACPQGGCLRHRRKLSGGQRDSMRAGRPRSQGMPSRRCRADHSRKNGRSFMKMNHECTRIDTKTDGPSSTTSGTRMLLQSCALGVTMSWDEGFPGARASRPHQAWHSLGHLPHLDQPGTAPWLSYGLAAAVPCDSRAACSIAGNSAAAKGTGCGRDARAPGGVPSRRCGIRPARHESKGQELWASTGIRANLHFSLPG